MTPAAAAMRGRFEFLRTDVNGRCEVAGPLRNNRCCGCWQEGERIQITNGEMPKEK